MLLPCSPLAKVRTVQHEPCTAQATELQSLEFAHAHVPMHMCTGCNQCEQHCSLSCLPAGAPAWLQAAAVAQQSLSQALRQARLRLRSHGRKDC